MAVAKKFTCRRAAGRILASCISLLLIDAAARAADRNSVPAGVDAAHGKPNFARGGTHLRPLFGKPHAEGRENNRLDVDPKETIQEFPVKKAVGTTGGGGFNPDPGGVTAPIFNPDPGAAAAPAQGNAIVRPGSAGFGGPLTLMGEEPMPDVDKPISGELRMPRRNVRGVIPVKRTFHIPEFYGGGYTRHHQEDEVFENAVAMPNRWEVTVPHWQRYMDPSTETPYMYDTPRWWHPYEQSRLKGDVPVFGTQDIFVNITAKNFSIGEVRKLPTPSSVSSARAQSSEFFGRSEQLFFSNDTSLAIDIFEGETAFKPVHWMIRVLGVYNTNWIRARETNVTDPDPRGTEFDDSGAKSTKHIEAIPSDGDNYDPENGVPAPFTDVINPSDAFNYIHDQLSALGDAEDLRHVDENNYPDEDGKSGKNRHDLSGTRYTTRHREFFALQEAFAELHISDLTDSYDFISSRFGLQPFVSDFRGFIYADTNLGVRIFGNLDNNHLQYNLVYFNQREKDTYSDLNTFDSRHQQVLIANIFRQDFLVKGYTASLSFHMNLDDGGTHYQKDGFATRPTNIGTSFDNEDHNGFDGSIKAHDVRAYYLGWTGDGHFGRMNITNALYYAFGEDEINGLAGRRIDISAMMAALELSYDRDWIRFKLSGFYASGDSDPTDRVGTGFDTIQENPFFIGGPFSWYVHQGFNLAGTNVNLKQRDSLIPNLRSSKSEAQSNFVNPGVSIVGIGTDIDVTPKLKVFANANYIWLNETKPIEIALQTDKASGRLGTDLSIGFKYRPFLTEQVVLSAGIGFFLPDKGYKEIYRRSTEHVPGYGVQTDEGNVDDFLYNGFLTLTLIY